ncbi:MAG: DinB family protein [Bacteroidota bacterium]
MTLPQYLSYVDDVLRPTESLFRLVPTDKIDWSPVQGMFTCGQMMAHIAGAVEVYAKGISSGEWGFFSIRERLLMNRNTPSLSTEDAVALLHSNVALFRAMIGGLSEDEFQTGIIPAPQLAGTAPRWRMALFFTEHHLNHKAEFFLYLRLLGVRVHTGTLYRGS